MNRRTALRVIGAGGVGNAVMSSSAPAQPGRSHGRGPKRVLEIVGTHDHDTDHHRFELSEAEIPSGRTALDFDNRTEHAHFVYPVKLLDADTNLSGFTGDTLRERYMNTVTFPFQEAWDPYYAGDDAVGTFFENLCSNLLEWFFTDTIPVGGPGLTAAGEDPRTTVNLTPDTYFLEGYVLDDEGVFNRASGMVGSLEVTEAASTMAEPKASPDLSILTTDGIVFSPEEIELGRHTVRVTVDDTTVYTNGLRHDVHLIRLEDRTTYEEVNEWMNYLDAGSDGSHADDGALTTAPDEPGPATFLGGGQDIDSCRADPTAYFEVAFNPGDYAWVSEVPDPAGRSLLHRFTISPPGRS